MVSKQELSSGIVVATIRRYPPPSTTRRFYRALCPLTESRHLELSSIKCVVSCATKPQKVSRSKDPPRVTTHRPRGSSLPAREPHTPPSRPLFFATSPPFYSPTPFLPIPTLKSLVGSIEPCRSEFPCHCFFEIVTNHDMVSHIAKARVATETTKQIDKLLMGKYALNILQETSMSSCKLVDSPMDPNMKLMVKHGEPYSNPERYRRLVGKLIYLTITRPDISFVVGVVSQFMQTPCIDHWAAVLRILRYIKKTPRQGLLYEDKGDTHISGYCDADWAGSPIDRQSTTDQMVLTASSPDITRSFSVPAATIPPSAAAELPSPFLLFFFILNFLIASGGRNSSLTIFSTISSGTEKKCP
ncbi:putative mitochondrial protein, partial [Mucuna pruriens]